ncbi:hypothetical protein QBC34DRAFT_401979 [Podospora aff. communis PSN243]|uniref:Uncharacterized protein n=1 Tax=Podospora aff. communis PSN243 TaxID=3040156 RepID=A0AAV9GRZ2_9PEZI|nr:hypothetical protein QBC34DRAFT_401979 [Podospora aff. communis PSN243]
MVMKERCLGCILTGEYKYLVRRLLLLFLLLFAGWISTFPRCRSQSGHGKSGASRRCVVRLMILRAPLGWFISTCSVANLRVCSCLFLFPVARYPVPLSGVCVHSGGTTFHNLKNSPHASETQRRQPQHPGPNLAPVGSCQNCPFRGSHRGKRVSTEAKQRITWADPLLRLSGLLAPAIAVHRRFADYGFRLRSPAARPKLSVSQARLFFSAACCCS